VRVISNGFANLFRGNNSKCSKHKLHCRINLFIISNKIISYFCHTFMLFCYSLHVVCNILWNCSKCNFIIRYYRNKLPKTSIVNQYRTCYLISDNNIIEFSGTCSNLDCFKMLLLFQLKTIKYFSFHIIFVKVRDRRFIHISKKKIRCCLSHIV
jgi:hypothetical protein